ncbi:MAG TPA: type II secretion system protein GspG [Planctomycetaceae bacterium]|nr:type II secretion system protein GspG [Planctomycetaceae bacterium]
MQKLIQKIPNRRSGFTLLELLIVLGIILAIAAMVIPNLIGGQDEANIKTTKINIKGLENALKFYYTDHKSLYPESIDILLIGENTADGRVRQPYLEAEPLDAWGNRLFYEWPNNKVPQAYKPAIWSAGPNRQNEEGAGDDINNWSVNPTL